MPLPIHSLLILVSIALAFWQWSRIARPHGRTFGLLGILIVAAFAIESYGGITNARHLNNSIGYNLFNLAEAWLVLLIVRSVWRGRGVIAISSGMLITAAYLVNLIANEWRMELLVDAIIFSALIQAALCMAVLWHLAQNSEHPLVRMPEFWILLGLLIYFAGIIPVVGLHRFVYVQDWPTASKLYKIVPVLCIVRYLLAAYACRLRRSNDLKWGSALLP